MSPADRQRVRSIFMEVADLPADERAQAISRLCGPEVELRVEVECLLAAERDAGKFMANPTVSAIEPATGMVPILERAGSKVGSYKILQVIGEGGFGTVFLAEQTQPVRRRVALKIIKLGMDTKQVVARFEAERQALALMDHPHIARVLDGGATESGRPYFVMEYVTGDAITAFAAAHKLTIKDRLTLFAQVCQAVQHAHHKGIIHRDLKPGNVLVTMTDGRPFAKVIDFGIAKATGAAGGTLTDKTLFTEHRQLIGTPEYMSPEQAEGSPDIDTRTDVYALGVLLYELLTGLTPFDGRRLRSAAFAEMQRIIKEEEPPTPSVRVGRPALRAGLPTSPTDSQQPNESSPLQAFHEPPAQSLFPSPTSAADLKGELDWIVMKALDKDRARRYETPGALAADLERHLAGEAVVAAPPSAAYRLRKFVRRNRGPVVAGSVLFASLLVGIAGTGVGLAIARHKERQLRSLNEQLTGQNEIASKALYELILRHGFVSTESPTAVRFVRGDQVITPFMEGDKLRFSMWYPNIKTRVPITLPDAEGVTLLAEYCIRVADEASRGLAQSRALSAELEVSNVMLKAELRRARLAEASITIRAFEEKEYSWVEEDFLASLDLRQAVSTRLELLGPSDPGTIRGQIVLATEDQVDHSEWNNLIRHWISVRTAAAEPVSGIDIELWSRLGSRLYMEGDFHESMVWLQRVGAELTGVYARESWLMHSYYSARPNYLWGVYSMRTADADRVAIWASGLCAITAESLLHQAVKDIPRWARFNWNRREWTEAVRAASLAISLRAQLPDDLSTPINESGPHPADLAILAMSHFRLSEQGDPADPAAAEHLAQSRAAMAQLRVIWSDPAQAEHWQTDSATTELVAEAEALVGGP